MRTNITIAGPVKGLVVDATVTGTNGEVLRSGRYSDMGAALLYADYMLALDAGKPLPHKHEKGYQMVAAGGNGVAGLILRANRCITLRGTLQHPIVEIAPPDCGCNHAGGV